MEINEITKLIACEIMCCKNKAKYVVKNNTTLFNNKLFICENCLKELNKLFNKVQTPKSIKNIYKKGEENEKR